MFIVFTIIDLDHICLLDLTQDATARPSDRDQSLIKGTRDRVSLPLLLHVEI